MLSFHLLLKITIIKAFFLKSEFVPNKLSLSKKNMDLKDIDLIPIVDKNKIVVKVKPKSEILKTNKFNFKLGLNQFQL